MCKARTREKEKANGKKEGEGKRRERGKISYAEEKVREISRKKKGSERKRKKNNLQRERKAEKEKISTHTYIPGERSGRGGEERKQNEKEKGRKNMIKARGKECQGREWERKRKEERGIARGGE